MPVANARLPREAPPPSSQISMAAATQTASIFHAIVSRLWALFDHAALPLQLVAYLFFWPILEALFFLERLSHCSIKRCLLLFVRSTGHL